MQEQTTIEKEELKIPTTLKALVEALIFAAQEPLSVSQIRAIYHGEDTRNNGSQQIEPETIRQIISDLNSEYIKGNRPYRIVQIAGGYQFATMTEYAEWLGRLYKEQGRRKLSQSGVETLAIVAYKQPITKAEIEKIRGVNCDYVLKTLLEKELLTVTGRAESVGRPLLYGTTKEFLKHFGLNDITDLPRPREIEEILGESQFETERRMLEAQEGAELMKKEQEDFKSRLPHIPKKKPGLEEKEVEIVPSTKIREIKIVPPSDRKEVEEAGQEKIVFNAEDATIDRQVREASVSENEKDQTESSRLDLFEQVKEELKLEETREDLQNKKEYTTMSEEVIGADKKTSIKERDIENNDLRASLQENEQHPKRWKVWKEKIQGFIKKLFA
jgi:segregation and condensation protein B